jgi:hypothetical protein
MSAGLLARKCPYRRDSLFAVMSAGLYAAMRAYRRESPLAVMSGRMRAVIVRFNVFIDPGGLCAGRLPLCAHIGMNNVLSGAGRMFEESTLECFRRFVRQLAGLHASMCADRYE